MKFLYLIILFFISLFKITASDDIDYNIQKNKYIYHKECTLAPKSTTNVKKVQLETHLNISGEIIKSLLDKGKIPLLLPPQAQIDLTNECNLNCSYCSYPNEKKTNAEILIQKLLTFLSYYEENGGKSIFLTGGGEPGKYSRLRQLFEFFSRSSLILMLNTNGYLVDMIEKNIEKDLLILKKICSKERKTIFNISYHNKKSLKCAKKLVKLRKRYNLNFTIRVSFLVSETSTPKEIENKFREIEVTGADIASTKPSHKGIDHTGIKGEQGLRVYEANDEVVNYLQNLDHSKFNIKIMPMRLNRSRSDFLKSIPNNYNEILCIAPLTRMVINALGELNICCTAKQPGIGMKHYFPCGDISQFDVFSYYMDVLWGMISFNNFYCVYGCGYLELMDEWDLLETEYGQILKRIRVEFDSNKDNSISKIEALIGFLKYFNNSNLDNKSIIKKLHEEFLSYYNNNSDILVIEKEIIPLIKKIPEHLLTINDKMDLLSLILADLPQSPISRTKLNFMFIDYSKDIANYFIEYVKKYPNKKSIRFSMMGISNGISYYYIRQMLALVLDLPIEYFAFETEKDNIESFEKINPNVTILDVDFLSAGLVNSAKLPKDFDCIDATHIIHEIYSFGGYELESKSINHQLGLNKIKQFLNFLNRSLSNEGFIHIVDGYVPSDSNKKVKVKLKSTESVKAFKDFFEKYILHFQVNWITSNTISVNKFIFTQFLSKLPLLTIRKNFDMTKEYMEIFHYLSIEDYFSLLSEVNFMPSKIQLYQQKTLLDECYNRHISVLDDELPNQRMKMFLVKREENNSSIVNDVHLNMKQISPVISISHLKEDIIFNDYKDFVENYRRYNLNESTKEKADSLYNAA